MVNNDNMGIPFEKKENKNNLKKLDFLLQKVYPLERRQTDKHIHTNKKPYIQSEN